MDTFFKNYDLSGSAALVLVSQNNGAINISPMNLDIKGVDLKHSGEKKGVCTQACSDHAIFVINQVNYHVNYHSKR